jgi:hypothetical protein
VGGRPRRPRPAVEGTASGGHGGVDLGGTTVGDLGQQLTVARRDDGEDGAAPGFLGAVDVVRAGELDRLRAAEPFVVGDSGHAVLQTTLIV